MGDVTEGGSHLSGKDCPLEGFELPDLVYQKCAA